jgi:hypothetical protein
MPILLGLAAILAAAGCGLLSSLPSDAELETVFAHRRQEFETLAAMAERDRSVVRIAPDFTWLENDLRWPRPDDQLGFSRERWEQYRSLFRQLHLEAGVARTESHPGVLFLIASAKGLVTGGSDKGYAFSRVKLASVDVALDRVPRREGVPVFKHLDGDWYLYARSDG